MTFDGGYRGHDLTVLSVDLNIDDNLNGWDIIYPRLSLPCA